MRPTLPKRFYKSVDIGEDPDGFSVLLDGKPLRTPAKNPLLLPTEAAAKLVASEWEGQEIHIDPAAMPITRLANTALDGVAENLQPVIEDILRFAGTDLLCYRAEHPANLVATQEAAWDPVLDWVADECGAVFETSNGILHVEQDSRTIAAFSNRISDHTDPFGLTCLHTMTSLTGSAILALAIAEGHLPPSEGWEIAHVDENFNIRQWGEDYEAAQRRLLRKSEMMAAAGLMAAVKNGN